VAPIYEAIIGKCTQIIIADHDCICDLIILHAE